MVKPQDISWITCYNHHSSSRNPKFTQKKLEKHRTDMQRQRARGWGPRSESLDRRWTSVPRYWVPRTESIPTSLPRSILATHNHAPKIQILPSININRSSKWDLATIKHKFHNACKSPWMLKVQAHSIMAYLKSSNVSMKFTKNQVEIEIHIPNMKNQRLLSKQLLRTQISLLDLEEGWRSMGFW